MNDLRRKKLSARSALPRLGAALALLMQTMGCSGDTAPERSPSSGAPGAMSGEWAWSGSNPVDAGCVSAPANATIQSIGDARSATNYGSSGCPNGFVVDISQYASPDSSGTVVAYSGPNSTDQAECESTHVEAFVFAKDPATGRYEALKNRKGVYGTGASGRMVRLSQSERLCERPHVTLDLEYPGFLVGGDYRVVMQTTRTVAGRSELRETTLVTPSPTPTPSVDLAQARSALGNDAVLSALVQRAAAAAPQTHELMCRAFMMDLVLLEPILPSLSALGASGDATRAYLAAMRGAFDALCGAAYGTNAFAAAYTAAARELMTRYTQIVDQVASNLQTDAEIAAGLVERVVGDMAAELMNQCAPYQSTLTNFLLTGAAPGPEPVFPDALKGSLFVGCTPASAAAAANAKAQALLEGITSGKGMAGTFRRCLADAQEKEFANKCTDPRADVEPGVSSETAERCMQFKTPAQQDQCISDAQAWQRRREEEQTERETGPDFEGYESCKGLQGIELSICEGAQKRLDSAAVPSPQEIQTERSLADNQSRIWKVVKKVGEVLTEKIPGVILTPIDWALKGGAAALRGVSKIQEHELRELCEIRPTHEKCQGLKKLDGSKRRCIGETFGDQSVTYSSDSGVRGAAPKAMTVFDRMDACYCEYMGAPVFGQDCMSPEERVRQECLSNPFGPDDAPRPECLKLLRESSGLDMSALLAGMCKYTRPNCDGAYVDINGKCGCPELQPAEDPGRVCPNANVTDCGPDSVFDQRSCGCQPIDAGALPWGNNPLCGNDPRLSPGGRDGFITRDPNDLLTNRLYSFDGLEKVDFHMVRGGGYVPVVSPALYTRAFDKLGTVLQVDIKMPDAVASSGYRGAAQAYCTSENTNNHYLGQLELANLELGSAQTLEFPVSRQDLDLCAGTDKAWRLEFAINSDPLTVDRLGLGAIRFAGTPVGVDEPLRQCPTPDPSPIPDVLTPFTPLPVTTPEVITDRIANPTTWTFSNGDLIQLRDR